MGKAERDSGRKPGLTTDAVARLNALERENRELRQANEILRKALDRPFNPAPNEAIYQAFYVQGRRHEARRATANRGQRR